MARNSARTLPKAIVRISFALLIIAPLCAAPVAAAAQQVPGLVSMWQGNGNTLDLTGINNGAIMGPVGYSSAVFGLQGFSFSGFTSG
ncbi:MAG TPA: hypothetical protein VGS41_04880, partial [Chthonomonadales bacterium]|nr:hypothetical protein [Chthonomonadales bacterium]